MKGFSSLYWVSLSLIGIVKSDFCNDAYQCVDTLVSSPSQTFLYCYGFSSCADVNADVTTTLTTLCDGSYACYGMDLQASLSVRCDGLYGCSNMQLVVGDDFNCYAERSCYNSIAVLTGNSDEVRCYGLQSCANSRFIVQNNQEFEVYGTLGLYNSEIIIDGSYLVYVYLYGPMSGKDLTININDTLSPNVLIYCYGNDACTDLTVTCVSGATSCYSDECALYSTQSQYCQGSQYNLLINTDETLPMLDSSILGISNPLESDYNCNDTNINATSQCLDYQECNSEINITATEYLCCSGSYSCQSVENLETIETGIPVRCDGGYSCESVARVNAIAGANLYFTGLYALGSSGTSRLSTTSDYDILCTGQWSCRGAIFTSARNLYCNNYYSCYQGSLITGIQNVYLYGYQAAYQTPVRDISGNIYVAGYQALDQTTVYNVGGTIYVTGPYGLQDATLRNVSKINAQGYFSLEDSYIEGFDLLTVNGYKVIENAELVSASLTGTTTLNINTTTSDPFSFTCSEGDICYINCLSTIGCDDVTVTCEGTCYWDCSVFEGDIKCPTLSGGSYFATFTDGAQIEITADTTFVNASEGTNLRIIAASILYCYGYSSCSTMEYVGFFLGYATNCDGSYSCYQGEQLVALSTVNCDGLSSCSMFSNLETESSTLYCYGELSCAYSKLNVYDIECYGDRSCMNTRIFFNSPDAGAYSFYGVMSAANSIFETESVDYGEYVQANPSVDTHEDKDPIYFDFWGASSGYNVTIVCGFWKQCIARCYGTNSCKKLSMRCGSDENSEASDDPNDGCDLYVLCDPNDSFDDTEDDLGAFENEDFCEDNNDDDIMDMVSNVVSMHSSTVEKSVEDCTAPGVRVCDNLGECSNDDPLVKEDGNICCMASSSCTSNNVIAVNSTTSNSILRCDGGSSCASTGEIWLGSTARNGSGYFTGVSALSSADLYGNPNGGSNIYCSGSQSCQFNNFNYFDNIICTGYFACTNSIFMEIANSYQFGYASSSATTYNGVSGYIYCYAHQACYGGTFRNVGGIDAVGYQVAYQAKIHNVTTVTVTGDQGLYESRISRTYNIEAWGIRVLEWALIVSNFTDNGTMELKMSMTRQDGPTWIICNKTDTCNIECVTPNTCQFTSLACYGECEVRCNNDEIACPYAEDGTSYKMKKKLSKDQKAALKDVTTTISPDAFTIKKNDDDDDFDWTAFMIVLVVCFTVCGVAACIIKYFYDQKNGGGSGGNQMQMTGQTSG